MPDNASAIEAVTEVCPNVELVDRDGNVIIVMANQFSGSRRKFFVSSKVLSLASPVFAKLFGPSFSEGAEVARSSCPEVSFHDDDPAAMAMIFAALHYYEPTEEMSPELLGNVCGCRRMTGRPGKVDSRPDRGICSSRVSKMCRKSCSNRVTGFSVIP